MGNTSCPPVLLGSVTASPSPAPPLRNPQLPYLSLCFVTIVLMPVLFSSWNTPVAITWCCSHRIQTQYWRVLETKSTPAGIRKSLSLNLGQSAYLRRESCWIISKVISTSDSLTFSIPSERTQATGYSSKRRGKESFTKFQVSEDKAEREMAYLGTEQEGAKTQGKIVTLLFLIFLKILDDAKLSKYLE